MAKIVHVTSVHNALDVRIFSKQCRSLVCAGYEVVLVAPHTHDEVLDGVQIRSVQKSPSRLGRWLGTMHRAIERAVSEKGDLYHFHDPELLLAVKRLSHLGYNTVFDMHEYFPAAVRAKKWIPKLLRFPVSKMVELVERVLLTNTAVIFAEMSYHKHYTWVRKHCTVLNAPLLNELPVAKPRSEVPTVGYVGGVSADRGSFSTLQALSSLKSNGYKINCEIVGPISTDHQQELISYITAQNLSGIHLHGYVKSPCCWSVISTCNLGLAVLKNQPNYVESFPTKVAEYMGMGLPVVTSNFPVYKEVVERFQTGICVNPDNVQEIADAIKWLLDHPQIAKAMGERGKKYVFEHYSWANQFDVLLSFYESLLHENRHNHRGQASIHQSSDCESGTREAA